MLQLLQVFCEEHNISFHQPLKDGCGKCTRHELVPVAERTPAQIREHSEHRKEAEEVRTNKDADQLRAQQEDSFACGSFDLMQVCSRSLCYFNMSVTLIVGS